MLLLSPALSADNAKTVTVNAPFRVQGFDDSGNRYAYQGGPTTPGAVQTVTGGGTCFYGGTGNGIAPYEAACGDAYIGKIDTTGNLVFGTLLGGDKNDQTAAFAVDSAGYVYFTGTTGGNFPTTPGAAIVSSSSSQSFAAKISPDGTQLIYSTYLPDSASSPHAIALDAQGNAYIAGASDAGHAFVLKLKADGSSVIYNTALAGSHTDAATALHSDAAGNLVVAGQTQSADFIRFVACKQLRASHRWPRIAKMVNLPHSLRKFEGRSGS